MDSQRHYENFIFIDECLEEIMDVDLKYYILLDFKIFFLFTSAVYIHISALHQ
jgi:hypothetical protein